MANSEHLNIFLTGVDEWNEWRQLVEKRLGLWLDEAHWLNDQRLIEFFAQENKMPIGERLIDACGKVFW